MSFEELDVGISKPLSGSYDLQGDGCYQKPLIIGEQNSPLQKNGDTVAVSPQL